MQTLSTFFPGRKCLGTYCASQCLSNVHQGSVALAGLDLTSIGIITCRLAISAFAYLISLQATTRLSSLFLLHCLGWWKIHVVIWCPNHQGLPKWYTGRCALQETIVYFTGQTPWPSLIHKLWHPESWPYLVTLAIGLEISLVCSPPGHMMGPIVPVTAIVKSNLSAMFCLVSHCGVW